MDLRTVERQLRSLVGKTHPKRITLKVGAGVEVRIDQSGLATYSLRYTPKGSTGQRRVALGTYSGNAADTSSLTPAAAIAKAQALRAQVKSGADPAVGLQRGSAPSVMADLCDRYAADKLPHVGAALAKAQRRDLAVIKSAKVGSLALGSIRITDVRKSDLAAFLQREYTQRTKEGLHAAASIASIRSTLRMVFGHAEDQGWLPANPAVGLKAPAGAVLTERDRVLTPAELGDLWAFLTAPNASAKTDAQKLKRQALVIIMLTGSRASEALNRRRKDFDLSAATMTITGAKTAASNRTVPLSPAALQTARDVLAATPADPDALLFPTPGYKRAGLPITSDAFANEVALITKALGHTQPEPWTAHDLRRTLVSWMEGPGGIHTETVRRLVGHVGQDVHQRVYSKDPRMEEQRAAVCAYERHVSGLAQPKGGNIVNLTPKGATA